MNIAMLLTRDHALDDAVRCLNEANQNLKSVAAKLLAGEATKAELASAIEYVTWAEQQLDE